MEENQKSQADVLYEICEDVFKEWNGENESEYVQPILKNKLSEVLEVNLAEQEATEIVSVIEKQNKYLLSLVNELQNGKRAESWLADKLKSIADFFPAQKSAEYLNSLDKALESANDSMHKTFTRLDGQINQGKNLDGFIAEQFHAQKFNLDAVVKESKQRAFVCEPPPGKTYQKNSVDVVVRDNYGDGAVLQRYQLKYGKTAKETIKYIKHGNYRGQQLVVPEEQVEAVQKAFPDRRVSGKIHTDKISGEGLTKAHGKELENDAQNGNWKDFNWNDYRLKDLAKGLCRNSGKAAAFSAVMSVLSDTLKCLKNDEHPKFSRIINNALKSGADAGVKCMLAGALKVGAEKGAIAFIPKGMPAGIIACMAHLIIENIKIAYQVGKGKLSAMEGIIKMEQTAIACVGGMAGAFIGGQLGMRIGEAIGMVFGPPGAVAGAVIGKTVGNMAGFTVGEACGEKIATGFQKLANAAVSVIKSFSEKIAGTLSKITTNIRTVFA